MGFIAHSSCLSSHASLLTPHSSLLTPHSSVLKVLVWEYPNYTTSVACAVCRVVVCSYELVTVHIVKPKDKHCQCAKDKNVTNSLDCSGPAKRKFSGRAGRWWPGPGWRATSPRRPWRSTGKTRQRFAEKRQILNDKFREEQLQRAKKDNILGAERSTRQEWLVEKMDTDNNITTPSIMSDHSTGPGNSGRAVKDIPGKEISKLYNDMLSAGPVGVGVAGEECAEGHQETQHDQECRHGQHQWDGDGGVGGVRPPGHQDVQGGELQLRDGQICGQDEQGGGGEVLGQHSGEAAHDHGQDYRAQDGGVVPFHLVQLRHPADDVSPVRKGKPQRRKLRDGLVQPKIDEGNMFFLLPEICFPHMG